MDAQGTTAIFATFTGPGIGPTNDRAIFSDVSGSLATVARLGDQAPGLAPGVNFSRLSGPSYTTGRTAFLADVSGPGIDTTNDQTLWSEASGTLTLVAQEGAQAPLLPAGVVFGASMQQPRINAVGQTTFQTFLTGPGVVFGNNEAIYTLTGGSFDLVARTSDPAPGTDPGVTFVGFFNVNQNALGETAFLGRLAGPGVDPSNQIGIWAESGGSLRLVARDTEPAPGLGAGVTFDDLIGEPTFNAAGDTAFRARIAGPGVTGLDDSTLWVEQAGTPVLVAREGDAVPGAGPDVAYGDDIRQPVLNDAGEIAFTSELSGSGVTPSDDHALFGPDGAGGFTLFLRKGQAAPGLPTGLVLEGFADPVLDQAGRVVVLATIDGPGVEFDNDGVLYYLDDAATVNLIAREGEPFEAAPGDVRTVLQISIADSQDFGGLRAVSEMREVAFTFFFTGFPSEGAIVVVRDPSLACDDGIDNDGDGRIDFDPVTMADPLFLAGTGDPACFAPEWTSETRACQDGLDNDSDGLVDFDGGQSIHGACSGGTCPPGVSDPNADGVADPDPYCLGRPWANRERARCGLGVELALILPLIGWLGDRRRRSGRAG